jgi:hypothetical protein
MTSITTDQEHLARAAKALAYINPQLAEALGAMVPRMEKLGRFYVDQQDRDSLQLTWDGEAEIQQYLSIPRDYTISVNGTDYSVMETGPDGLHVWPHTEEGPYPADEDARLIEWDAVQTLHIY